MPPAGRAGLAPLPRHAVAVLIGLLVALVAMVLNSAGALLQADGARRATRTRPIAIQPRYLGGLLVDLMAWLCSVLALRHLPVFAVQAVLGGAIALTSVAGARSTGTRLDRITRFAVSSCVAGLALVAASAGDERPAVDSPIVDVVLFGAALALGVVVLILRQSSRAWPLALVGGLGFGGTALAVRSAQVEIGAGFSPAVLLGLPATYLVLGYGMVGMIGYSAALARGAVGVVTAVLAVTMVILPGLVGIGLLGDSVRTGWGWPFVIGLAVSVAAVVVLTRTPARRSRVH